MQKYLSVGLVSGASSTRVDGMNTDRPSPQMLRLALQAIFDRMGWERDDERISTCVENALAQWNQPYKYPHELQARLRRRTRELVADYKRERREEIGLRLIK